MRLAVFDTVGNFGGGSRFLESLLPALKECRPGVEIVYYGNPASVRREGHLAPLSSAGIAVKSLLSQRLASDGILGFRRTAKLVRSVQKRCADVAFLPASVAGAVHREIERVGNDCDVAYFPWPYLLECPRLRVPMVATFHDFNFRYFFGLPVFNDRQSERLNRTSPDWLARATPVVSTRFMASEAAALYPECRGRIQVVYLAPLLPDSGIGREEAEGIVRGMGVRFPYVIYPTHLTVHKNIGPLLVATFLLGQQGRDVSLVLTGSGTQAATGRACPNGVARGVSPPNVTGLGYVTNRQMDALIRCASAVVSSSLYEAGNGPGLDAWARGIPVAMSGIPPFLEHVEVQGVRAKIFDPRDPSDIAEKIGEILSDPDRAREDAQESLRRIREVTWRRTAEQYLSVFERAVR
jgi:glycosyltransferase involved in cell wall biosynthesis